MLTGEENDGEQRWLGQDRNGDGGGRGRFLRGFLKGIAGGRVGVLIGRVSWATGRL